MVRGTCLPLPTANSGQQRCHQSSCGVSRCVELHDDGKRLNSVPVSEKKVLNP